MNSLWQAGLGTAPRPVGTHEEGGLQACEKNQGTGFEDRPHNNVTETRR